MARPCPAWGSRQREPERTPQLGPYRYRTGLLSSRRSRDGLGYFLGPAGHRYIVRLCGPSENAIVAAGLSETGANRVAEPSTSSLATSLPARPRTSSLGEIRD